MSIEPTLVLRYTSGNSDKIWGHIIGKTDNKMYYTFWGKVGGVIAFKAWSNNWTSRNQIGNLECAKKRKGYKMTTLGNLPYETQEKYDQAVVMATLGLLRVK